MSQTCLHYLPNSTYWTFLKYVFVLNFISFRVFWRLTSSRGAKNIKSERHRDCSSRAPHTPRRGGEENYTTAYGQFLSVLKDVDGRDTAITCNNDTKTPIGDCLTVGTRSRGGGNKCGYDTLTLTHICGCHTVGTWHHMCGIICNVDIKTSIGGCLTVGTWSRGGGNTRSFGALSLTHNCGCHTVGTWNITWGVNKSCCVQVVTAAAGRIIPE